MSSSINNTDYSQSDIRDSNPIDPSSNTSNLNEEYGGLKNPSSQNDDFDSNNNRQSDLGNYSSNPSQTRGDRLPESNKLDSEFSNSTGAGAGAGAGAGNFNEAGGENSKVPFKAKVEGYAKKIAGKTFGKPHEVEQGEARLRGEDQGYDATR